MGQILRCDILALTEGRQEKGKETGVMDANGHLFLNATADSDPSNRIGRRPKVKRRKNRISNHFRQRKFVPKTPPGDDDKKKKKSNKTFNRILFNKRDDEEKGEDLMESRVVVGTRKKKKTQRQQQQEQQQQQQQQQGEDLSERSGTGGSGVGVGEDLSFGVGIWFTRDKFHTQTNTQSLH